MPTILQSFPLCVAGGITISLSLMKVLSTGAAPQIGLVFSASLDRVDAARSAGQLSSPGCSSLIAREKAGSGQATFSGGACNTANVNTSSNASS